VDSGEGFLTSEAVGNVIANEDKVLQIHSIHVAYRLRLADPGKAEAVQRAYEVHQRNCPIYRTLSGCVQITTELHIES
jgi:uncharacterized OsmC-like protein